MDPAHDTETNVLEGKLKQKTIAQLISFGLSSRPRALIAFPLRPDLVSRLPGICLDTRPVCFEGINQSPGSHEGRT